MAASSPAPRTHYGLTLSALAFFVFGGASLQTLIAPALPTIEHELDVSATTATWVLTIPMVVASVTTPILGRLGDMFGKKRVVIFMCMAAMVGCLVAALPLRIGPLLLGRALQGLGIGALAVCFGIIRDEFPPARLATGFGLIGAMWGVGSAAGLSVAGVIVDQLSFRWLFWAALGLLAIACVGVQLLVPESPVRSPARIDWVGAALFGPGLVGVLLGVTKGGDWGWSSPSTLGLFSGGAVFLWAWAGWELKTPAPMIDVRLLRRRVVWSVNATSLLTAAGMFSFFLIVPKLAQAPESTGYGLGASATAASLYLVPMAVAAVVAAAITGTLVGRLGGKRVVITAILLCVAAFVLLALGHGSAGTIMLAVACNGATLGFLPAASATLVNLEVPHAQTGEANGMISMLRIVGAAAGATVMAAILAASVSAGRGYPTEHGYRVVSVLGIAILAVAFVIAARIPDVRNTPAARDREPRVPASSL